jgi:hypothetical protein
MKPSDAEMQERHKLADRYHASQEKAKIDDQIRGIRTAINFLIAKEEELRARSAELAPATRPTGGRGGA